MGGGLSVENKSDGPILVQMSQVTPLYWGKTNKDTTFHRDCGKVWFTVSAEPWYSEKQEPTVESVIESIALISIAAIVSVIGVATVVADIAAAAAAVDAELSAAEAAGLEADAAALEDGGEAANLAFRQRILRIWNSWSNLKKAGLMARGSSPFLWMVTMAKTGTSSVKPCKQTGVYANGKTLTIQSRKNGDTLELYFA